MADTYFNSLAPALMVASLFLLLSGRVALLAELRLFYRASATVAVAVAAVLPVFSGLSVAGLLLSLSPVFSIGSVALLLHFILKRLCRRGGVVELFNAKSLLLFSMWNTAVGAALYSCTLGLLPFDLYFAGYAFSWPFAVTGALTLLAIYFRSRLAFLFLAYVIAWNHTLLPSPNFFDYVIDPFLFIVSIGYLIFYGRGYFAKSRRVA